MIYHQHKLLTPHILQLKSQGLKIGYVPTMGALHMGHISLMQQALLHTDHVIVSIFVNPTQFNNTADLDQYPKTLQADGDLINSYLARDKFTIYAPAVNDIYKDQPIASIYEYGGLENLMEGKNRPGHFNGVGTILEFLFKAVVPDVAFFGEKDYQQLLIVKQLVINLQLDINIVGCAIKRETHGLAMSSRNERLSVQGRKQAAFIYHSLLLARDYFITHSTAHTHLFIESLYSHHQHITLEYFTIASANTLLELPVDDKITAARGFIVAHIEGVRLIDNIALN